MHLIRIRKVFFKRRRSVCPWPLLPNLYIIVCGSLYSFFLLSSGPSSFGDAWIRTHDLGQWLKSWVLSTTKPDFFPCFVTTLWTSRHKFIITSNVYLSLGPIYPNLSKKERILSPWGSNGNWKFNYEKFWDLIRFFSKYFFSRNRVRMLYFLIKQSQI